MSNIKIPLEEKYRPKALEDVVGDSDMLKKFNEYIANKSPPHLLFVGSPGIGKTTCAKIIANSITQEVMFLNSSDKRGIDVLRNEIITFCSTLSWDDSGMKIIILDEVDNLTNDSLQALRGVMEEYIETARFFLTGNNIGRIPEAIKSRCQKFDFNNISKNDIAKRCKFILDTEGIKCVNFARDIKYIINEFYPDIRQIVGSLSKFTVGGVFQIDQSKTFFARHDMLVQLIKEKNWRDIRTKVCGTDTYDNLFKVLFDRAEEISPDKVEIIMILVAEGMKSQAAVADFEVNFMSTVLKIIQEI
jgi:replication-associated recombination protein RarA